MPLPPLPPGYVFATDENGNYLLDESGNYLIVPAEVPAPLPYRPNDGRNLFPSFHPAPRYATKILVNQSCSMLLPVDAGALNNVTTFDFMRGGTALYFTRPDRSQYVVVSTFLQPLIYLTTIRGQTYIVYDTATNELNQSGCWHVFFTVGSDYTSPRVRFQIYLSADQTFDASASSGSAIPILPPGSGNWLLASGSWVDGGIWNDADSWTD